MCEQSYKLHYIDKIRPTTTTSALIFGSALDNGLNTLLLTKDLVLAKETFEQHFKYNKINDVEIYVPTSLQLVYKDTDFDHDILSETDVECLKKEIETLGLPASSDYLSTYKKIKKDKTVFGDNGVIYYNYASWLSLRQKGILMLEGYNTKIVPKLTKIHLVQHEFKLENSQGDSVIGVIDLVADVEGHGTVILDNKSAARPYESDSVRTSEQLSMYMHAIGDDFNTRKAGYIVALKNVNKNKVKICKTCFYNSSNSAHSTCPAIVDDVRCKGEFTITTRPEINFQLIIDDISMKKEESVIATADVVNTKISSGVFNKCDIKQCENWFGQKCCYYNLCHGDGSMANLIKKKDKENGGK